MVQSRRVLYAHQGMTSILPDHREDILRIARAHGASNVRVFGSRARGDARPDSDLDLLVELEPGRSLFDYMALINDLEDALGVHVDVVTSGGIHPLLRNQILAEAVPV